MLACLRYKKIILYNYFQLDLPRFLEEIRRTENFTAFATALTDEAESIESIGNNGQLRDKNWCLVLGNEGFGISQAVLDACEKVVKIEMQNGVDSLSIGIAAAVFLHWLHYVGKRDK